ncbi:MAG: sporulation protein YunB [Candidatus Ornithomonoglobus sp.]
MKRKHSAWKILIPALCLIFIIFCAHRLLKRAEPVFVAQCSNYSNTAFTDLVNKCVIAELDKGEFDGFFKIISDSNERITAIEADTAQINRVKAALMIDIQNTLNNDYPANVYIPLGSLSGYYLLSSLGPVLSVKIIPISIVNGEFDESFEDAGINQVRHKIYLTVTVDMQYRGYLMNETERIETSVPIAETVIAGEVPEYYGGSFAAANNS